MLEEVSKRTKKCRDYFFNNERSNFIRALVQLDGLTLDDETISNFVECKRVTMTVSDFRVLTGIVDAVDYAVGMTVSNHFNIALICDIHRKLVLNRGNSAGLLCEAVGGILGKQVSHNSDVVLADVLREGTFESIIPIPISIVRDKCFLTKRFVLAMIVAQLICIQKGLGVISLDRGDVKRLRELFVVYDADNVKHVGELHESLIRNVIQEKLITDVEDVWCEDL